MTGSALARAERAHVPAGAPASALNFHDLMRRAEILAKTDLVPRALQGKPEAIALVGMMGAELGFTLGYSLQNIDVIDNKPTPNAQSRLALLRSRGHEVRFVASTSELATLKGRRREYRNDPSAWVQVTYTIEDARRAGLLDQWVERKYRNQGDRYDRTERFVVGNDQGLDPSLWDGAADWIAKEVEAKRVKHKDNWWKDPTSMLRAGAARHLSRMEFSDVMAGLGVEALTDDEFGFDPDSDFDSPAPDQAPDGEAAPTADLGGSSSGTPQEPSEISYCSEGIEGCPIEGDHQHDTYVAAQAKGEDDRPDNVVEMPSPSAAAWIQKCKELGIKQGDLIRQARDIAGRMGIEPTPGSLDEIVVPELVAELVDWMSEARP